MVKAKRLLIIDSNSVIHRAFHALPPLTTKKGKLVNAVYGFLLVFFKAIKEFHPDYVVACFDFPAPTFRHKEFKEYKAKRPPVPKELYQQIKEVKKVLKTFNVPIFEKEGFEADDIIGTISKLSQKKQIFPEIENIILSGDLDTLQLINKNTKIYLLKRGVKNTVLYDKMEVKRLYQGLSPEQLIDYKALKGDPSDNIPGIPGIGEKTAIYLIQRFKNLDNLYKEIEKKSEAAKEIKDKLRETLIQHKDQAFFNRMLATVKRDVPINFIFKKSHWGAYDKEKVTQVLKEFDFYSLIKRLPELENKNKRNEKEINSKNLRLW